MTRDIRRKLAIILAFTLTFFSYANSFADDANGQPEIISYSQLMTLSTTDRAAYIEGVQKMLIELSKSKDGGFSDSNPQAKSRLRAMLEYLNEAMKTASAEEEQTSCGDSSECSQAHAKCWAADRDLTWNAGSYRCVPRNATRSKTWEQTVAAQQNPKPSNYVPLKLPRLLETQDIPEQKPDAASEAKTHSAPIDIPPVTILSISKQVTRQAQVAGENSEQATTGTKTVRGTKREAFETKPTADGVSEAKKPAAVSATGLSCAPKPQVCVDPKFWRTKAFTGNQKCIFAGMISQLDSRNRKCDPVTEYKVGQQTLKCDAGQTMCNPLLFGTTSSKKPICVGRGNDATYQCSIHSAPRDAEKFINRNVAGLQGNWDDFKAAMAQSCKPESASAKFHCAECNIMQERIFALNARILLNPCGSRSTGQDAIGPRIKIRGQERSSVTK